MLDTNFNLGKAVDEAKPQDRTDLDMKRSNLGDAELAGCQLPVHLLHLLGALGLGAFQLLAALHHRLHFGLHLADVKTSNSELFVDDTAALLLLRGDKTQQAYRHYTFFSVHQTLRNAA